MNGRILLGVSMFVACGCASVPKKPAWTNSPAKEIKECRESLCAVGIAEASIKSLSLRDEASESRGRQKILATLQENITRVQKEGTLPEGVNLEQAAERIVKGSISGAYLYDKFTDQEGNIYALMVLNNEKFKKLIDQFTDISPKTREFIRNRTDELLKDAKAQ